MIATRIERQNGWNGPVAQAATVSIEPDGIYMEHADSLAEFRTQRLAKYTGEVVCLLFAFDFGTTGRDTLQVYVNPESQISEANAAATIRGEFTFDRLQFMLADRPGSWLEVDEVRIGTKLVDVVN